MESGHFIETDPTAGGKGGPGNGPLLQVIRIVTQKPVIVSQLNG
jgi:hypothetical protein